MIVTCKIENFMIGSNTAKSALCSMTSRAVVTSFKSYIDYRSPSVLITFLEQYLNYDDGLRMVGMK